MNKQTLLLWGVLLAKLVVWVCLSGIMFVDYVVLYGIDQGLLDIYKMVMIVCSVSFLGTYFSKIRKISYVIFLVSFVIYILFHFVPEIEVGYKADSCLESGRGVWDYNEHRCRTDCYHWSKESGCLKDD